MKSGMCRHAAAGVLSLMVHSAAVAAPVAGNLTAQPTQTIHQGQALSLSIDVAAVSSPPSSGWVIQSAYFTGGGATFSSGAGQYSSDTVQIGPAHDTLFSAPFIYYQPGQFLASAAGALYQTQWNQASYAYSQWVPSGYYQYYSYRCGFFSSCTGRYWVDTSHWEQRTGYSTYQQNDSTSFSRTLAVNVLNVAPYITALHVPDAVMEGEDFAFDAAASDPGRYDVLSFAWDFDGDGQFDDFAGPSGAYHLDSPGAEAGSLRVCDNWGGCTTRSFAIDVDAVEPEAVALLRVNGVPEPATIALAALGLAGLGWSRRKRG